MNSTYIKMLQNPFKHQESTRFRLHFRRVKEKQLVLLLWCSRSFHKKCRLMKGLWYFYRMIYKYGDKNEQGA